MTVEMTVIGFVENRDADDKPIFQVKLYGADREHGVLLEFAQPDNELGFAMKKAYRLTLEAK